MNELVLRLVWGVRLENLIDDDGEPVEYDRVQLDVIRLELKRIAQQSTESLQPLEWQKTPVPGLCGGMGQEPIRYVGFVLATSDTYEAEDGGIVELKDIVIATQGSAIVGMLSEKVSPNVKNLLSTAWQLFKTSMKSKGFDKVVQYDPNYLVVLERRNEDVGTKSNGGDSKNIDGSTGG